MTELAKRVDMITVNKHLGCGVMTFRRKLGMNQQEFWSRIGVTQSGGSRYESGRDIPVPTFRLLLLNYVHGVDDTKVNKHNALLVRAAVDDAVAGAATALQQAVDVAQANLSGMDEVNRNLRQAQSKLQETLQGMTALPKAPELPV